MWWQWYQSGGEKGEEPPAEYIRLTELWEKIVATLDAKVHEEDWNEMRRILTEQVFVIPIIESTQAPLVFSKKLGNVPHGGFKISAVRAAEQMFFKE